MAEVQYVFLGTIDIADNINQFIKSWKAIQAAKAGKKGIDVAKAKANMAAAITAVADTIISLFDVDPKAAASASIALNTAYLTATGIGLIGASIAGIVGAILGIGFGIATLVSKPPRVYWKGRVDISFNERHPYRFGVKVITTAENIVGDIAPQVAEQLNIALIQPLNEALSQLPKENSDFVLRWVVRPPKSIDLDVDAGRATEGVEERFCKALAEQLLKVQNAIKETAVMICYLHFLAELSAKTLIEEEALTKLPQVAYKVEGLWRRELQRLAIKLMQRREYTRQLRAILQATFYYACCHTYSGYTRTSVCGNPPIDCDYGVSLWSSVKNAPALGAFGGKKGELHFIIRNKIVNNKLELYTEPSNWATRYMLDYANYLLGEIPKEAVRYISKNLATSKGFIKWHIENYRTLCCYTDDMVGGEECAPCYKPIYQLEANFPEALNAVMQDIIDLYQFWQKGYAEEWKKRMRVKILNEMLPEARVLMKPRILELGMRYAQYPEEKIPEAIAEIQVQTVRLLREKMEEIVDYLPMIEKNKDWIIKHFGEDEYNRLLTIALERHKELKLKELEAKKQLLLEQRFQELKQLHLEEQKLKEQKAKKEAEKEKAKEISLEKMKELEKEVERLKKEWNLKTKQIKEKQKEIKSELGIKEIPSMAPFLAGLGLGLVLLTFKEGKRWT
ncbi:MAG TPA: hypothetical protein ENG63_06895 [Candidatus Desulfofervidus auxilii]|uniref:Uncharacterized protein n=1 Tax=Desulfofervidus auxilii TaxID=1621989 RepID=A0A7C0Y2Y8_DESA2|nr:hypothetical protein [Candidatus Desulfofervidus auxilii]